MSLGWYLKSFIIWSPEFYQIHPPCLLIAIAVQPNRALACLQTFPISISYLHSCSFLFLCEHVTYLFQAPTLSTLSHEVFLNHARRLVICYKFLPQFFLSHSFQIFSWDHLRNTFCTGTHFVQTYVTHTHTHS